MDNTTLIKLIKRRVIRGNKHVIKLILVRLGGRDYRQTIRNAGTVTRSPMVELEKHNAPLPCFATVFKYNTKRPIGLFLCQWISYQTNNFFCRHMAVLLISSAFSHWFFLKSVRRSPTRVRSFFPSCLLPPSNIPHAPVIMVDDTPSTLRAAEVAHALVKQAVSKHNDRYDKVFVKAVSWTSSSWNLSYA